MRVHTFRLFLAGTAAVFLLYPGDLSAKEKRGTDLSVTRRSGDRIEGELIAVRPDGLLLLDPAGADISVPLDGIESVRFRNGTHALRGALFGSVPGALIGSLAGHALGSGEEDLERAFSLGGALAVGAAGGVLGLIIGAASKRYEEVFLDGQPEPVVRSVLVKLNRLARMPDPRFEPR